MRKDLIRQHGYIAAARKCSGFTQSDMSRMIGVSIPTIIKFEKNPEKTQLKDLRKMYGIVGVEGKEILRQFISEYMKGGDDGE